MYVVLEEFCPYCKYFVSYMTPRNVLNNRIVREEVFVAKFWWITISGLFQGLWL